MLLTRLAVAAAVLFAAVTSASAQTRVAWSHELGDFSEMRDVAAMPDGGVIVAFTSVPCDGLAAMRDQKDFLNRIAIARFAADGRKVFEIDVPRPEGAIPQRRTGPILSAIRALAVLDDGDFLAVVDYLDRKPWLLRFSADGGVAFMKPLATEGEAWKITKIVRSDDEAVYLAGVSELDVLVAKYSESGQPLWRKTYNAGSVEIVTDAVADGANGVVVAAVSGKPDPSRTAPSEIVLLAFDRSGVMGEPKRFPGREPSIARSGGRYAVVFDRGSRTQVDARLKVLDGSLRELSETQLDVADAAHPQFRVAAQRDAFVVFGNSGERAWTARFTASGTRSLEKALDLSMAFDSRTVTAGEAVYVASTASVAGAERPCLRARVTRLSEERGASR